jgi:hypothetical protein
MEVLASRNGHTLHPLVSTTVYDPSRAGDITREDAVAQWGDVCSAVTRGFPVRVSAPLGAAALAGDATLSAAMAAVAAGRDAPLVAAGAVSCTAGEKQLVLLDMVHTYSAADKERLPADVQALIAAAAGGDAAEADVARDAKVCAARRQLLQRVLQQLVAEHASVSGADAGASEETLAALRLADLLRGADITLPEARGAATLRAVVQARVLHAVLEDAYREAGGADPCFALRSGLRVKVVRGTTAARTTRAPVAAIKVQGVPGEWNAAQLLLTLLPALCATDRHETAVWLLPEDGDGLDAAMLRAQAAALEARLVGTTAAWRGAGAARGGVRTWHLLLSEAAAQSMPHCIGVHSHPSWAAADVLLYLQGGARGHGLVCCRSCLRRHGARGGTQCTKARAAAPLVVRHPTRGGERPADMPLSTAARSAGSDRESRPRKRRVVAQTGRTTTVASGGVASAGRERRRAPRPEGTSTADMLAVASLADSAHWPVLAVATGGRPQPADATAAGGGGAQTERRPAAVAAAAATEGTGEAPARRQQRQGPTGAATSTNRFAALAMDDAGDELTSEVPVVEPGAISQQAACRRGGALPCAAAPPRMRTTTASAAGCQRRGGAAVGIAGAGRRADAGAANTALPPAPVAGGTAAAPRAAAGAAPVLAASAAAAPAAPSHVAGAAAGGDAAPYPPMAPGSGATAGGGGAKRHTPAERGEHEMEEVLSDSEPQAQDAKRTRSALGGELMYTRDDGGGGSAAAAAVARPAQSAGAGGAGVAGGGASRPL